ncbi:MAG TPA: NAD-dependent epimerase/dehydratase family protein [Geminicoccaceae bacterium]|nr:NAD-dependent epimerase/dehydratase family protein [Geminicoccaceae bacterium]
MPAGRAGRILLVGRGSFLAQHALAALSPAHVEAVGHDQIERPDLLDGVGCIVSFCRHPLAATDAYRPERMDPDLRLARRIGRRDVAYVMLSSRKVYAPGDAPLSETSPIGPGDAYGRHKLALERMLRDLLGERLTVLRLANVFGYERIPGRRTFVALSLDQLAREACIHYAMSPFVERDFLPVTAFAQVLAHILTAPPGGVLNVGSGIGLPTGRLALWILEGLGRGALVIDSIGEKDAFVLDVARLTGLYGPPCSYAELRDACVAIGRRLAEELAQSSR